MSETEQSREHDVESAAAGTEDTEAGGVADAEAHRPHRLRELSARNVLVAVDSTPEAWDAVGLAVQIVRSTNGRLTLLTVVVPAPAWTQVGLFAVPEDGSSERAAEKRLRELVDAIPDDLPVTSQLLHGDAAHLIAQRAEEGNHDLVVLAAHEHGPIAAAIESVQRRLLRHTSVPVLAIRRPLNDEELAAEDEREPDPPA
ncbi:universal stress protein [Conexibacter woesei]|uniref:UspA domain protein n=1 Tax=Conexibacter woesei (strain DSM 14684 / CCUG 47730 / CIP 108061 / JCM 11494 / NBRC 100937 / ID131577) TaxID=469383 RepID=D3FC33_CONWI|nr:universal stress protein [Conexibacter woesei]ADB53328.1 UspA domain protein [Conexibacter woesei DSM 14684]